MTRSTKYTTTLGAGLGLINETLTFLELWKPGMEPRELYQRALSSGAFPAISASRLDNMLKLGFAPRYLCHNGLPATIVKSLKDHVSMSTLHQLMFWYTARANVILYDFVREVYWSVYASGQTVLSNEVAREFVDTAVREGKTTTLWSDSGKRRVAGYLTGCCADYGLLERGRKTARSFQPFHLSADMTVVLAYDLRFAGLGDNAMIAHPDWELFGLQKDDVREELRRLALKGFWIMQTAGEVTRISWNYTTWEDVLHAIAEG